MMDRGPDCGSQRGGSAMAPVAQFAGQFRAYLQQLLHRPPATAAAVEPGEQQSAVPILLVLLVATGWFGTFKVAYLAADAFAVRYLWATVFILVPALFAGWRQSYAGMSAAYSVVVRGSIAILGCYALVEYHVFPPDLPSPQRQLSVGLEFARALACIGTLVGMFRPAFGALPAFYVLLVKDWTEYLLGLPTISRTDYLPVVELVLFSVMCVAVFNLAGRMRLPVLSRWRTPTLERITSVTFIAAVAIHFGNYFYSGVEKLRLDGGPLSWVLENATYVLIPNTIASGHMPLAHWPELTWQLYGGFVAGCVFVNALTLVLQLLSVVAITSFRRIVAISFCYDLTHVVIFFATGIFFWKWILLNMLIVVAASKMSSRRLDRWEQVLGATTVVAATLVFFAARLAWYDSPAVNRSYFVAIDRSGAEFEVPSNYFTSGSITVAQMRLGVVSDAVFPTGTWGTTSKHEIMKRAQRCDLRPGEHPAAYLSDVRQISDFIRSYHRAVLARVDERGRFNYDLYPHHIWSNPWRFERFQHLDKRSIVAYKYITDVACLNYIDGIVRSAPLNHHEIRVDVSGS